MEALVKQTSVKLSTSESHGSNRTGVASGRFKLLYFQRDWSTTKNTSF